MKWIKKGYIFKPSGELEWSREYAQIPRPILLEDRIRIFYAKRYYDEHSMPVSQTSFIDVDRLDLTKVLYVHNSVSLELGSKHSFSQNGIHPTMLLESGGKLLFYYQGWKRLPHLPYETAVGLAESTDKGLTFTKAGEAPIFQKSETDTYFVNGVFIYPIFNQFIMYYSGGTKWVESGDKKESVYVIKSAVSTDLIHWTKHNKEILTQKSTNECQNTPCVVRIGDKYHMWFSYRPATDFRNKEGGYRIGYATSDDLYHWERDDSKAGISVSDNESWDSQMVCYPYVFQNGEQIQMLYCGNYFGKEGFGYAELEIEKK